MLEQIAYESSRVSEQKQVVYTIGDLESLSASALYYGGGGSGGFSGGGFGGISKKDMVKFGIVTPSSMKDSTPLPEIESIKPVRVGMNLPGGLSIKDLTKNCAVFQEDFGGVGNIYTAHPDGSGATRFYGTGKGKKKVTKSIWDVGDSDE